MAQASNNPFDFSKLFPQFDSKTFIDQFQQSLQQLKLPNIDSDAVIEAQRKNLEALTAANRTAIEGTQQLFDQQAKLFEQAFTEASTAINNVSKAKDAQSAAQMQTALVKTAFEKAMANSKEISDLIQNTQVQVSETVKKRIAEGMDEIKTAIAEAAKN